MELKQINQVCEINPRASEISDLPADLVVSFVPMEDVPLPRIEFNPYKTKTLDEVRKKYTYFKNSDIILAKVTPCFENGKIAIANNLVNGIGFGSSELYVIRCSDKIDNKYLFYILQSNKFLQEGTNTLSGTSGLLRVPRKFIEEYEIPLPSLEIQKQIVAECEAVEARQRELLAQNLAEKDQLKRLRESLLNKAISGQLVPQIEVEGSAEELYQQIQAKRSTPSAFSVHPSKRRISPVLDSEIPFSIPKSWKWVRLGEIFKINPSQSELLNLSDDTIVSFVPMEDVPLPGKPFKPVKVNSLGQLTKKYTYFREGDVLLAKVTPCFENGKKAIATGLENGIGFGSSELYVLRSEINTLQKYLFLTFHLEKFITDGSQVLSGTSGLLRVQRSFLENYLFPLPPLAEQARIVSAVEAEMTKIQSLEALNQENHTLISKMLNQFIRERIG